MNNLYCPIIHGGLHIYFDRGNLAVKHCCLRDDEFPVDINTNYWKDRSFNILREQNKQNVWARGCENCQSLEASGQISFRSGMKQGLGISGYELSGPSRIDITGDISCNLACRTCGPNISTFWQKHLKIHNLWDKSVETPYNDVVLALKKLDLSNLRMVVFCGGETMLGQSYWSIAEWLADNVPNAKQQLTLCFQTNGTQSIHPRQHELIDRFHLVKLHVSLDGINERFEYLRWPAEWNQVVDNILHIRESAPSNTMFLIEETMSIFNLWYSNELSHWVKNNFTTNREGDPVDHTRHLAIGIFSLAACSQEYLSALSHSNSRHLIPQSWQENPDNINKMINEIKKFDNFRNQSFEKTFPEVAEFYARFL
jgi:sulfatase maturation enzyme AslB (radical SAM superfamily)